MWDVAWCRWQAVIRKIKIEGSQYDSLKNFSKLKKKKRKKKGFSW
jgi:hypothetical protein